MPGHDAFGGDFADADAGLHPQPAPEPLVVAGGFSGNGRTVAFDSAATDLTAGTTDANGGTDVYVTGIQSPAPRLVFRMSAVEATTTHAHEDVVPA